MTEEEANRLYDCALKQAYELVGKDITFLSQLNGGGRKLLGVKFKGVFPSDKIPQLNDLAPYCILNLDTSKETGSHWIALAKMPKSRSCLSSAMVYDSFGRDYKTLIRALDCSGNGRMLNTDPDVELSVVETDCGARSLAWLLLFDSYGPKVARLI